MFGRSSSADSRGATALELLAGRRTDGFQSARPLNAHWAFTSSIASWRRRPGFPSRAGEGARESGKKNWRERDAEIGRAGSRGMAGQADRRGQPGRRQNTNKRGKHIEAAASSRRSLPLNRYSRDSQIEARQAEICAPLRQFFQVAPISHTGKIYGPT